tara:strand:- start:278 stop:712 length:435 start_codon:yes stop_codon:yes gene_type:complete
MQEPEKKNQDLPSLYSLTAIGVATFLGSILAGGYMVIANYLSLGEKQMAKQVAYGTAAVILIWIILSMQMAGAKITTMIAVNMGQVVLALIVANKLQGKMFSSYQEMGGKYYGMGRVVAISIIASIVFTVAGALIIAFIGGAPK